MTARFRGQQIFAVRYPSARTVRTKIYGISFRNADGVSRQRIARTCRPGLALELVREPHNVHDSLAVAVFTAGGDQLGYLGGHRAHDVAGEMDGGRRATAVVAQVTGGGGWPPFRKRRGVNIEITIA